MFDAAHIEEIIGYKFRDRKLLTTAFTHQSYSYINNTESYDRLEYLGDSVIALSVSVFLIHHTPSGQREGVLSRIRAEAVDQNSLSAIMKKWDLYDQILHANVADLMFNKVPSDVVEAVVGAIFMESGFDTASRFVVSLLKEKLSDLINAKIVIDPKSQLQERVQAMYRTECSSIHYTVADGTEDALNGKNGGVRVCLTIDKLLVCYGVGKSKKEAERDAAQNALKLLTQR